MCPANSNEDRISVDPRAMNGSGEAERFSIDRQSAETPPEHDPRTDLRNRTDTRVGHILGMSALVMRGKTWQEVWVKNPNYSHMLDLLYSLLLNNTNVLRWKSQVATTLHAATRAHPKWTHREILRAADLGYIWLLKPHELPKEAQLSEKHNDSRRRYPMPTPAFVKMMARWHFRLEQMHEFSNKKLRGVRPEPQGAALPGGLEWDFEDFMTAQQVYGAYLTPSAHSGRRTTRPANAKRAGVRSHHGSTPQAATRKPSKPARKNVRAERRAIAPPA